MKKLGLIGGSGPESTLIYYKEINERIHELTNETCFPEFTIENIDLCKISIFRVNDDLEGMKNYLLEHINNLYKAGCNVAALTAGTLHMVYDELSKESPIPLVSIPKVVSQVAQTKGYAKVGLLGTDVTMRKDHLKKDFYSKNIEVFIPSETDQSYVHNKIFNELEKGIIKESTLKAFQAIILKMKEEYDIDAIVLGCTELPLLLNEKNSPVPVLDIMRIHIDELVNIILEK